MEANGYAARLAGLERIDQERAQEIRRHGERITTVEIGQGVQETQIRDNGNDLAELKDRMDRMARAFWAAAATFMGLTLTCVGIIVTVLAH